VLVPQVCFVHFCRSCSRGLMPQLVPTFFFRSVFDTFCYFRSIFSFIDVYVTPEKNVYADGSTTAKPIGVYENTQGNHIHRLFGISGVGVFLYSFIPACLSMKYVRAHGKRLGLGANMRVKGFGVSQNDIYSGKIRHYLLYDHMNSDRYVQTRSCKHVYMWKCTLIERQHQIQQP
jgi:hypothetical protein